MRIARCTLSQKHWFVCTRKPIICPHCKKREVKPSMFGMPTEEAFRSGKWHIAGCEPDLFGSELRHRDWGCCNCDAAFFKESKAVVDSFLEKREEAMEKFEAKKFYKQAIALISKWPKDKDVPRLMRDIYEKSNANDKIDISRATEALYTAAESEKDFELIEKFWK